MPDKTPNSQPGFSAPLAQLDLPSIEHQILKLWRDNEVETRSLQPRVSQEKGAKPSYAFYDGPPFATGLPHYGHLLAGTIKDIVPRFWSMSGKVIDRRFGWDCHGLPIESQVEDQLGVHGRVEIEELGVPKFNAACRAGVLKYTKEWETVVKRMGRWVDFERGYKTMDSSFMESVWWVFTQLWQRGLIYQGYRVQPVSPALGTPLSNFEVALGPQEKDPVTRKEGYKRRQDPSLTVRFALEDEDNSYLWVWTTTPWTLPSNLAIAVHPEFEYVKVRLLSTGETAYVEPGRLADYQKRGRIGETEELARLPGKDLIGRPYRPLFPFFAEHRVRPDGRRWAFKVVSAGYVTKDSGTGLVHQAPAFGEDDFQTGQREELPLINPLNLNGIFDQRVGEFSGLFAKDADKKIIESLRKDDKIVDHDVIVHAYPHCYRSDQPLLYMAIATWFMKVESFREELVRNNELIRWVPEHVGSGRFGNWLASARDWNLSRNRYWGTPLPVWQCDKDPEDRVCVGSISELEGLAGLEPGSIKDLHRESIDPITFPSKKTDGGIMIRVSEVFDCWFESGSMPYAQNHYPFNPETKLFVEENLPADFIAEGLDQTRGWFYTLHVLATALFQRPAFKNVIVNGLILAADGKKMSKRLKNYPDPQMVIETYGADALRAYLINSPVVRAEPMRFGKHAQDTSGEAVRDTVRLAILPLWNAYNFLVTYARADGWFPQKVHLSIQPKSELDRWMLSRLTAFNTQLKNEFENYCLYNLVPAFLEICDDLNNWYIRRGRRRYWRVRSKTDDGGDDQDKLEAYATLYRVIVNLCHSMAPVLPFFCEYLYQQLVVNIGLAPEHDGDSVHLQRFPEPDPRLRDIELEEQIAAIRQVIGLAMGLRERERIGVRRPLPRITVATTEPIVRSAVERFREEILGELNIKEIVLAQDDRQVVELSAKANFKILGRRLGARMKAVASEIEKLSAEQLQELTKEGSLEVGGERISVEEVMLRREPLEGWVVDSSNNVTVVLDTKANAALAREGLARELINRIQNFRKQAGLLVSQRIVLAVQAAPRFLEVLNDADCKELISAETLAVEIVVDALDSSAKNSFEYHTKVDIEGDSLELALSVANTATISGGAV